MILVDTSVWIAHLRNSVALLTNLLERGDIVQHPMVTAELALGSIKNREIVIGSLENLLQAAQVSHDDLLEFINAHALPATGVGLVDTHLLASCKNEGLLLWTYDKRLRAAAERLGCAFSAG